MWCSGVYLWISWRRRTWWSVGGFLHIIIWASVGDVFSWSSLRFICAFIELVGIWWVYFYVRVGDVYMWMFGASGSHECFCESGLGWVTLDHLRRKSNSLKGLGLCICDLEHWKCVCSECWKFVSVCLMVGLKFLVACAYWHVGKSACIIIEVGPFSGIFWTCEGILYTCLGCAVWLHVFLVIFRNYGYVLVCVKVGLWLFYWIVLYHRRAVGWWCVVYMNCILEDSGFFFFFSVSIWERWIL